MTDTTHLGLPFIEDSQAQKHVTHNEALRILDAVIQIVVADMTRTAPPASPAEGQRHVVASSPTGAWAGHATALATWQDGAWVFLAPKTGWCLWSVADTSIFIFDGGAWQALAPLANDVGQLGVNTTASTPNLLSIKSNAALLAAITSADGGSGDARLQISKQAAANTASVFFSDNYSGRAEFGLTGDDQFRLKVSPDGASWQDAFVIDNSTGNVAFHGFSDVAAMRSGLGLIKQALPSDATADRVMTTGAFGLGGIVINLAAAQSANASRPTGFYYCNGCSNMPTTSNGWLSVQQLASNYCVFQFVNASDGRRYTGELLNSVWTGWTRQFMRIGSNATGKWTIDPNGWQICTQSINVGAGAFTNTTWGSYRDCGAWALPANFSTIYGVWGQVADGVVGSRSSYASYIYALSSSVGLYVSSPQISPDTSSFTVNVVVMGLAA